MLVSMPRAKRRRTDKGKSWYTFLIIACIVTILEVNDFEEHYLRCYTSSIVLTNLREVQVIYSFFSLRVTVFSVRAVTAFWFCFFSDCWLHFAPCSWDSSSCQNGRMWDSELHLHTEWNVTGTSVAQLSEEPCIEIKRGNECNRTP